MWDKAREILHHCVNVVLVLLLIAASGVYVLINSILVTRVVNDFRLDTYMTVDTGFGIVMLVCFLGWAPIWLMWALSRRR